MPLANDDIEAKWANEQRAMRRSMTNELFKEFQSDGCFDVAKEIWKSKNIKMHFANKHK